MTEPILSLLERRLQNRDDLFEGMKVVLDSSRELHRPRPTIRSLIPQSQPNSNPIDPIYYSLEDWLALSPLPEATALRIAYLAGGLEGMAITLSILKRIK